MHGLAIAALIIYGVLYGLFHLILFLGVVFRDFWNYAKKIYHKYYTQKKYNQTLIGRVEKTHRLIQAKIQEITTAINALKTDLSDHQNHIKSQNDKLKQDQLPDIRKIIEREIKLNTQRIKIIEGYIKLFKEFLAPIYKERNGIEALLEIIRFNNKKENIEGYSDQFDSLTTEITFYSKYDFISISNEIILHLDSSIEDLEIASADRYLQEQKQTRSLLSDSNGAIDRLPLEAISDNKLKNLETLILRDFENSLAEFEAVKADFKRVFKR